MRRQKTFKVLAVLVALLITALLGEISLRLFFKDRLKVMEDERSLADLLAQAAGMISWGLRRD